MNTWRKTIGRFSAIAEIRPSTNWPMIAEPTTKTKVTNSEFQKPSSVNSRSVVARRRRSAGCSAAAPVSASLVRLR